MFDIRAAIYDVDVFVDALPASKITWTASLNETSTFTVETHRDSGFLGGDDRVELLSEALNQGRSLVIEIHHPDGGWVEYPHAYGVLLEEDEDDAAPTRGVKLDALGADYDLSGAVVLSEEVLDEEGRWQFPNSTPGEYLIATIDLAHTHGLATAIAYDFTATHDSAGQPWPAKVKWAVEPSTSPRELLDALADQYLIDWRMNGNTLQMFAVDTEQGMRRDRTHIELVLDADVLGAPQRRSVRDRVDDVLILGDQGMRMVSSADRSPHPRGRRAVVQQQSGVSDSDTAALLVQALLAKGDAVRAELTRDIRLDSGVEYLPFIDYLPGDMVVAPGYRGTYEELRIYQITLTKDADGVTGSVILADRFVEREVQASRRLKALAGGAPGGTNTSPLGVAAHDLVPWNLLRNARFDNGLAHWASSGAEVVGEGVTGTRSARLGSGTRWIEQTVAADTRPAYAFSMQVNQEGLYSEWTPDIKVTVEITYADSTEPETIELELT